MRVCIDGRLVSGEWGGVESVVIGLAIGLALLEDHRQEDEYVFLAWRGHEDYLRPFIRPPCRIELVGPSQPSLAARVRAGLKQRAPRLAATWRGVRHRRSAAGPPPSDGTVERLGAAVVHQPIQTGFLTDIPTIYHPHDLQHLHLPQLFALEQRERREALYRRLCGEARLVAVSSMWTKRDVERQYGLAPEQVQVVPLAPVVRDYPEPTPADLRAVLGRHGLPDRFLLYPAQTWPHKNHARLIDALARLRDEGRRYHLVCTGRLNEHFPGLAKRAADAGVADQISWLGHVAPAELHALYRLAHAVVIPTLFEAASGPLWDAFAAQVPAACSTVTSLPDQAGDAAVLFDPLDLESIAAGVRAVWSDEPLRERLVRNGTRNVARFSWENTAGIFRAHYRRIAGGILTERDRAALASPPPF